MGCHIHSSLPTTCYQYTVVGEYCTLCVQIVWLLGDPNWHEVPWKPDFFYFQIVNLAEHQVCFYPLISDIDLFLDQINSISKNIIHILKSCVE